MKDEPYSESVEWKNDKEAVLKFEKRLFFKDENGQVVGSHVHQGETKASYEDLKGGLDSSLAPYEKDLDELKKIDEQLADLGEKVVLTPEMKRVLRALEANRKNLQIEALEKERGTKLEKIESQRPFIEARKKSMAKRPGVVVK